MEVSEDTNVGFFFRFQINTLEIFKRISELLKPKVNVAVPVGFSDNFESFKVEGLPKLKDRFLNGIFINKIRESGKIGTKRQVKECTNDRLERRGGFPPWTLGFHHGKAGGMHQNKENGRRTEMQSGISILKIVLFEDYSLYL